MLSGLKHFRFCRRRWALVHLEQQWSENVLTLEGHYMHERVHDDNFTELRGSILLSRGMPIRSETLKITGQCDMVELHRDENGVSIQGREGKWRIYPVEYKHGRPDERGADELQLCAQAMCLEEMFHTTIPEGAIFYTSSHRRLSVELTEALRQKVCKTAEILRSIRDGYLIPKAEYSAKCKKCSLSDICMPKVQSSAKHYCEQMRREAEDT